MTQPINSGEGERYDELLDATGLSCPMPLLKTKQKLNQIDVGKILHVKTSDPGSVRDFEVFLGQAGYLLLKQYEQQGQFYFWIQK